MTIDTLQTRTDRPSTGRAPTARGVSATAQDGQIGGSRSAIGPQILERAARVIRVLGHPLRLRILEALEDGEHHVTDLVAASGASQALVSQHLAILRAEGVVGFRRDGPRIYYRITEPKVHRILDCIRDCDMPELSAEVAVDLFDLTGDH